MTTAHILEGGGATLNLTAALLLYTSREGHIYATSHEVLAHPKAKGAKIIGPGIAATKAALADFASAISAATAYNGMVPYQLLYTGPNIIAWWAPAAARRVWFKSDEDGIGTKSEKVWHPSLVFIATPQTWYVHAVCTDGRPDGKTPLYKAPYFNVWENGSICAGNVELPDTIGPESMTAYENAFFRSRFTHPNDDRLVRYKGGAKALWRDQLAEPEKRLLIPDHLTPRKETLERAIKHLLKKD